MQREIAVISVLIVYLFCTGSCNAPAGPAGAPVPGDTAAKTSEKALVARGEVLFTASCGGCHNFKQSAIGPSLGGIVDRVPKEWIRRFIRDPGQVIASGDPRAVKLFAQYKATMPSFGLKDTAIDAILSFLGTQKGLRHETPAGRGGEVKDPVPARIGPPDLEVAGQLVTQFPSSDGSGQGPAARITKLDFEPHSGRSFVVDLRGKLYRMQGNRPEVYMDIARLRPAFIHEPRVATGFGSFAFHPDFGTNGLLYTTHSERAGTGKADFGYADSIKVALQWVVTEWKVKDPHAATFSGTGRELLRVNMVSAMHGIQEIAFDPLLKRGEAGYGLLYICIGDGACVEEGYPFLAHDPARVYGSILRIDPGGRNSANGRYGIPPGNPFAGRRDSGRLGEIYAYGFRNPHRITWSRRGTMLACNIGQTNIESINLIRPGHDYGWPLREGNFVLEPYGDLDKIYPLPANDSIYGFSYPIAEYDHDEGKAIAGGFEYTGTAIPALRGKFLFGDIPTGRLFYIEMTGIREGRLAPVREWRLSIDGSSKTLLERCGGGRADLHFGRDRQGELYIMTKTDGRVYRLVGATRISPASPSLHPKPSL